MDRDILQNDFPAQLFSLLRDKSCHSHKSVTVTPRISIRTYVRDKCFFDLIGYHIFLSLDVWLFFSTYCLMDQYNHNFSFVAKIM